MKINKVILSLFLSLLVNSGALAQLPTTLVAQFNQDFKSIVVDLRGTRFGSGDVAAGYLTIMDLILNYKISAKITAIVDPKSRQILENLADGNVAFWKSVKVETVATLQPEIVFDLYLALANRFGKFKYGPQISENAKGEIHEKPIRISANGVLIVQTVLGNTETHPSLNEKGIVRTRGINYLMEPPGIAKTENGIYNDYIATSLRDSSAEQTKQFVMSQLPLVKDEYSRQAIEKILIGEKLSGSKIGLVYGISLRETKSQFLSYLKGLTANNNRSYALVTPSGISAEDVPAPLKDKVQFIDTLSEMPDVAVPGMIYFVKTHTLPHGVFVGLIGYAMKTGFVPVGAGDGFTSAAINLGGPFVLTKVEWNAANIENLYRRLISKAESSYGKLTELWSVNKLLSDNFEKINFERSQELQSLQTLFRSLSADIPDLSGRIINASVNVIHQPEKSRFGYNEYLQGISCPTLRASLSTGGTKEPIFITDEKYRRTGQYDYSLQSNFLNSNSQDNGACPDLLKP